MTDMKHVSFMKISSVEGYVSVLEDILLSW